MTKKLHIVCFDNPYPPNYGGVIDVFFKIKSLKEVGVEIILHVFYKDDLNIEIELEKLCFKVFYYPQKHSFLNFFNKLPYSVICRNQKHLINNLKDDNFPILFESLKTTYFMYHPTMHKRKKILRLHNLEDKYFKGLSKSENRLFYKFAYYIESIKFKKIEKILKDFDAILTLSKEETNTANTFNKNTFFVPVFHGNTYKKNNEKPEKYTLIHGDYRLSDNLKSLYFVIDAFKKLPQHQLIIASSQNNHLILSKIKDFGNIKLVFLQNFNHLKDLLNHSHIHISWSFQESGTKLKVINALFHGNHQIINKNVIDDNQLIQLCHLVNDEYSLTEKVNDLMQIEYNETEKQKRILENYLNDIESAKKIVKIIFS